MKLLKWLPIFVILIFASCSDWQEVEVEIIGKQFALGRQRNYDAWYVFVSESNGRTYKMMSYSMFYTKEVGEKVRIRVDRNGHNYTRWVE